MLVFGNCEGVQRMFFRKIFSGSLTEPRYIRRTRAYLEEANKVVAQKPAGPRAALRANSVDSGTSTTRDR